MERKVFLCLDCHAIFYDGVNHRCPKVNKLHFISKLGIEKKHSEDIYGTITDVSQNNGVGQIESLNYPSALSISTEAESQLNAEYLQNIRDGSNAYMKSHQEEHPDVLVMKTSQQDTTFDLSFHPRRMVSLKGNDKNNLASDCIVGVQSQTSDTREETTNYSTVPGVSSLARDLQNDSSESSITKSIAHNYVITPLSYEQERLQGSGTTSGEYCSTTGLNNEDLRFYTKSCRETEQHESMNEINNFRSTNILESNCISKNIDFVPLQRDDEPHLQNLPPVISQTCDIGVNKLAGNDVTLVSKSYEHPVADPTDGKVEDNFDLRDGRFFCRSCDKSYTAKHSFVIHYRSHTGERPYECDQCPKTFTDKKNLNVHYKIHFDETPYPCDMWEKRFFSHVDLDNHQLIHSVQRPYACDKCTKRYTEQSHLTVHLRTHTGEKRYPCDKCDKKFTKKKYLDNHRQTHFTH